MKGIDLRDREALIKRNAIFGAAYAHDVFDVTRPTLSMQTRYVVTGEWKLLLHHSGQVPGKAPELYNLSNDPAEETDLTAKHPNKVKELRRQVDAWWPGPKNAP